jgi:hypothetical protein
MSADEMRNFKQIEGSVNQRNLVRAERKDQVADFSDYQRPSAFISGFL